MSGVSSGEVEPDVRIAAVGADVHVELQNAVELLAVQGDEPRTGIDDHFSGIFFSLPSKKI